MERIRCGLIEALGYIDDLEIADARRRVEQTLKLVEDMPAPTPPEVEPFGYVTNNGRFYTVDDAHRSLTKEQRDFVFTKVYVSPPSPKTEYSPDGEPLNLLAATLKACEALEMFVNNDPKLHQEHMIVAAHNLRKFLDK